MLFWNKKVKKYKSDLGWFEMELPKNWERYDDEPGTHAFFDQKNWKENFRISSLKVNKSTEGKSFFEDYLNKGGYQIKIDKYNCVFFKEANEEEGCVIYSWHFNTLEFVFIVSYTCNINDDNTLMIKTELEKATEVIKSIKLL